MRFQFLSESRGRVVRARVGRRKVRRFLIERLESRVLLATTPIISEILASNSGGLRDRDGESSDWIELYNPTPTAVDLEGWKLTDDLGDLNQWVFPSIELKPNDYLVVFASGKNRAHSGSELHTNFRLSSEGEFLALVKPDGLIASQLSPSYPAQANNVSYGVRFETQTFLTVGSAASSQVPTDDTLGNTWTVPGFSEVDWEATPVGVGFGVQEPGFDITYVKSNVSVGTVNEALQVLGNPAWHDQQVTTRTTVVNFMGNGGGGRYGKDNPFPTQSIGDDINDFVVRATSTVIVPSAGAWSFGVNSDDGFRLTLSRDGVSYVVEYVTPRAPADTIGILNLPSAGEYALDLVMFERAGGASVELFAAAGSHLVWSAEAFDLVGDTTSGGLQVAIEVPAGSESPLRSDIGSSMLHVNASAFIRIPFTVEDPSGFDAMRLRVRYDDGFVGYLNGVEIARRNAPENLTFDSSATRDLTIQESLVTEDINLSEFLSTLQFGENILAIHGLNSSLSDSSFLILPELIASRLYESEFAFFEVPTPGGPNGASSLGIVDRVQADTPAGFYDVPVLVALSTQSSEAAIRYTLDGSTPTATHGILYTAPIDVSGTTTLRAVSYRNDYISLPSMTRTYLYVDDIIVQSATGSAPPGWPSSWGSNVVDYGMDPDVLALEGASAVKSALQAIPSLSITTDLANLFDPGFGIYANPWNDGRDWERPASLELLNPDGSPGFQVNAGLRIRGGFSRSTDNPKHSFRLFFRGQYGDSTLDYPMFGLSSSVESIKKLDLRTAQNYSWSFGGDPSNNFVTDGFSRLTQLEMGQPSTRSDWYHLYINGQYWGLFQTQERAEAEFAESYFGGLAINYDVIKAEAGPYAIYATDGNLDAWYRLWDQVRQNQPNSATPTVASNDVYLQLQGLSSDGSENLAYENLLDVDNLIVYMINILYGGNLDAPISNFLGNTRVNNFYAIRDRTARSGFKFFLHDSEHTLRNVNENRNGPWPAGNIFEYSNPQWLHQRLMANGEYRMRFADLVQRHFFYEGALSVVSSQTRFLSEAAKIDSAVRAESARWGDAKRPDAPLGRSDWLRAVTGIVGGYFPNRNSVVIQQFRNTTLDGTIPAKLFPTIDAPTFIVNGNDQRGGAIPPESHLRFGTSSGLVYYTTDGTDPRMFGGGIRPDAMVFDPQAFVEETISAGSIWKYRDTGEDLGSGWRSSTYDDSHWSSGNAELGYGDGDETTQVGYGPNANSKYITTYFRKSFTIDDASSLVGAKMRLKRDDGAVVFVNGIEVARSNMPTGVITATTLAASVVGGNDESKFYELDFNPGYLNSGLNVIAIEVHQVSPSSSDLSFDAQLLVTRQSAAPIAMGVFPVQFRARVMSTTGEWSALEEAAFSVPLAKASVANLRITELHYNPTPYSGAGSTQPPLNDAQNFEFLEFRNISNEVISMDGVRLTGVTYIFPSGSTGPVTWLLPGESLVVVKNRQAFATRYQYAGSPFGNIKIAPDDYGTTNLSNGGEELTVYAYDGTLIQQFTFDDNGPNWPSITDGNGPSLTILRTDPELYSNPLNWRASYVVHGTPGFEENDPPIALNLSNQTVTENAPSARVGALSTVDYDDLDEFSYSLLPQFDATWFTILGDELYVASNGLDFEEVSERLVAIRSTDRAGAFVDSTFTITILDVNEAPVLSVSETSQTGNVLSLFLNSGTWSDPEGDPVSLVASLGSVELFPDGTWTWSYLPATALQDHIVTITASDGSLPSSITFVVNARVTLVNRFAYYNNSGYETAGGVSAALDTSKTLLRATGVSQATTSANVINYSRGINGIVLDVAGMPATSLAASDFVFRVAPSSAGGVVNPSAWGLAPTPTVIHVTPGTATTPARVRLEWNDNAIQNTWLQIIVLSNANTGLVDREVYYLGHALGDADLISPTYRVTTNDVAMVRAAVNSTPVSVSDPRDVDKDRRVTTNDVAYVRARVSSDALLRTITVPAAGSGAEGEGLTEGSMVGTLDGATPFERLVQIVAMEPKVQSTGTDAPRRVLPRFTNRDYAVKLSIPSEDRSLEEFNLHAIASDAVGRKGSPSSGLETQSLEAYFAEYEQGVADFANR